MLLADYGVVVPVTAEHMRGLPAKFELVPSFAIRVHLDEDGLVPIGGTAWNKDAVACFRKYLVQWQNRSPTYFAYRHGEPLQLVQFEQNLIYNFPQRKWIAMPVKPGKTLTVIDNLKDHPMLHNLYRSVGMTIEYEIVVPNKPFWFFQSISDELVAQQNAVRNLGERSKLILHVDIVDTAKRGVLAGGAE